jgi:hypothetical protein
MKALLQLKLVHLWKQEYYKIARDVLNCIKPVGLIAEMLSNHDANLLTSENLLFSNLENCALSSMPLMKLETACLNAGIKILYSSLNI